MVKLFTGTEAFQHQLLAMEGFVLQLVQFLKGFLILISISAIFDVLWREVTRMLMMNHQHEWQMKIEW